jgi:hypothetical protein
MENENLDSLDIRDFVDGIQVYSQHELRIGRKILNDLNIDPERDDDIIIHCSSADFQSFIARIIMTALNTKKFY